MQLFLGCDGSQPIPGCLTRHIDLLNPHVADTGPKDGNDPGVFGPDIEGRVHDPGRHEDAIAWAESSLLLLDPMLDRAGDHINEFLLVGVIVEAVSLAGKEDSFQHREMVRPC